MSMVMLMMHTQSTWSTQSRRQYSFCIVWGCTHHHSTSYIKIYTIV